MARKNKKEEQPQQGSLIEPPEVNTEELDKEAAVATKAAQEKLNKERAEVKAKKKKLPVAYKHIEAYVEEQGLKELKPFLHVKPIDVYNGISDGLKFVKQLREMGKEAMIYFFSHWPTPPSMIRPVYQDKDSKKLLYYYVPVHYFLQMIRSFFPPGDWGYENIVMEMWPNRENVKEVTCEGDFWVKWPDGEITPWHTYGGCQKTSMLSIANLKKGAQSDFIKRACYMKLGIARDVYSGEYAANRENISFGGYVAPEELENTEHPPIVKHMGGFYAVLDRWELKHDNKKKDEKNSAYYILAQIYSEGLPEPVKPQDIHFSGKTAKEFNDMLKKLWEWRQNQSN